VRLLAYWGKPRGTGAAHAMGIHIAPLRRLLVSLCALRDIAAVNTPVVMWKTYAALYLLWLSYGYSGEYEVCRLTVDA